MINITNFIHHDALTALLQTWPINQYLVLEGELKNAKTFESSDVIIASIKQAKSLHTFTSQQNVSVILWIENKEHLSETYAAAKELNAFAVICAEELSQLHQLVEQAYQSTLTARKEQFGQGKTVGVFSVKGGTGKSFIAYQLASQLSIFTKTQPLLIDAGLPFGSARALLNIQAKPSWQVLRPLLKTGKDLTKTRVSAQILHTQYHFELLNAPAESQEEALTAPELKNLVKGVQSEFPITILDLPHIAANQLASYTQIFDLVIWVFTPDANSILQTLELSQQIQSQHTLFVCNMVEPATDHALISSVATKLAPSKTLAIEADPEAIKLHQRKFELLSDESLLLTTQLKELAQVVFFTLR